MHHSHPNVMHLHRSSKLMVIYEEEMVEYYADDSLESHWSVARC
jgi:hypothetical protein